jgi:hypothetical protein
MIFFHTYLTSNAMNIDKLKEAYWAWAKSKSTAGYKYGSFASDVFQYLQDTKVLEDDADHCAAIVMTREIYLCNDQRHSHPVLSYETVDTFLRKGSGLQMDIIQRAAVDFNKKYTNQNWEKKDFDETVLEWMEKNLHKY